MGRTTTSENPGRQLPGWCQPFLPVVFAFATGIAGDRWAFPPAAAPNGILEIYFLIAGLSLFFAFWWGYGRRATYWSLLISFALAGAAEHHVRWRYFSPREIGLFAEEHPAPAALRLTVTSAAEPIARSVGDPFQLFEPQPTVRFTAWATAVRCERDWQPVTGRVLVYVVCSESFTAQGTNTTGTKNVNFLPGEKLQVFGRLRRPPQAMNPGEFDRSLYLRGERILAEVSVPYVACVTRLAPASLWDPRALVAWCRLSAAESLQKYLSEENRALGQALLLGFRQELPDELEWKLIKTGTLHLLAISGLHVGIFVGIFGTLFWWLSIPRRVRTWCLIGLAVIYTFMTGAPASAVRAATVVILLFLGKVFHQSFWSPNGLAVAALLLLIWNPAILFQPGAHFSFLGASVLIVLGRYYFPGVEQSRSVESEGDGPSESKWWVGVLNSWIVKAVVIAASIWLIAWPLTWKYFHLVTPLGIILTPLLLLLISGALITGFGIIFLGPLCPWAAWPMAWVCDTCLTGCQWFVEWGERFLPLYTWQPDPPGWWVFAFYVCWLLLLLVDSVQTPRLTRLIQRMLVGGVLLGVVFLVFPIARQWQRNDQLRVTILSIGHGLGVLVETPDGQNWMYDLGSIAGGERAARVAAGTLWTRGIRGLDGMFLSHADLDHYNGLPDLADYVTIQQVLVTPMMFRKTTWREPGVRALAEMIAAQEIPLRTVAAPAEWTWGGCRVTVLHPPADAKGWSDNAASLVLWLEYAGKKILLTGDLERPGLAALLRRPPCPVDVLVAPHHGSLKSQPRELARWSQPKYVIISGSAPDIETVSEVESENAYQSDPNSPSPIILHTAKVGAVIITISHDGRCEVSTFRSERSGHD